MEVKEILSRFDEIGRFENPVDFHYDSLMYSIKKLKVELETEFEYSFDIDGNVQDASFICDLIIPDQLLIKPNQTFLHSIRFSNFGRLTTINGLDNLNLDIIQKILPIIRNSNFIYLDSNEIDVEYDGKFENFKSILNDYTPTWYTRYFDYL